MTVGVDVGGTFTDVVWWDGDALRVVKVPSTGEQSLGVLEGVHLLLGEQRTGRLLHGTTVATNTLLQRNGARTVLVVDAGYEDLIEIARQDRPSLYDPASRRPRPLIEPSWRIGADPDQPPELTVDLVRSFAPEAVAVSLLGSFADPRHERRLGEALAAALSPIPISLSHRVAPEFREYERASTTALNAYLQPAVARYLSSLSERASAVTERVLVMRSSGGLASVEGAATLAASIVLSGPAGGVVAAAALGQAHGWQRVISFDMGGTSTDVCRIESGRPEIRPQREIDGIVCRLPAVGVHTIGAGGGSVAWQDTGGSLRVGPRSAGAHPGPAAYGRGGREATVTDANLVLGRLGSDQPLGGTVSLDPGLARKALTRVGTRFNLTPEAAAAGVIEVVEAHMERALRAVSVEEGADPRQAALVAFGGAGGLHASGLARRLGMPAVLIPPHAGVFSALGLLLSPPRHDTARTVLLRQERADELELLAAEVIAAAVHQYQMELGVPPDQIEATVDVRYLGQSHETGVPYHPGDRWARLGERFHSLHAVMNGFARPNDPIEVVTLRAAASGSPDLSWSDLARFQPSEGPPPFRRSVITSNGPVEAEVWWRPVLGPGDQLAGPVVIEETDATTWIEVGELATVLDDGTIEVSW